jgi:hypothetical protein
VSERSELKLDLDAIFTAVSRSTSMKRAVESAAKQIEKEAASIASIVAFDEGYYSQSFKSGSGDAQSVRRQTNTDPLARRNRRRRGQLGTNRFLDVQVSGEGEISGYTGPIGVVVNTDFKAYWVEYGSIAKGPRRVLLNAAEKVAARIGAEIEVLYNTTHTQNTAELAQRISAGRRGAS